MTIPQSTPTPEDRQPARRNRTMTPEHRAKISAALKRYHAENPDSHVRQQPQGEDSRLWKGGVAPYSYRRIAFEAHGKACQRCGSARHINAHHINEDRSDNRPENLEVLCRSCHNRAHNLGGNHGRRAA